MSDENRFYPGYWADQTPDKLAYVFEPSGVRTTYGELEVRSNRAARLYRSLGLVPGDFIAVLMENDPRYIEVCWGAQRSGLGYTPINHHLQPEEVEYIANDCGAKLLLVAPRFAETAARIAAKVPGIRTILSVGGDIPGFDSYDVAAAAQSDARLPDELDGADMIYTSGSTGRPKGGKNPFRGVHPGAPNPGLALFGFFGLDEHSTYLSPGAPLYHAAPLRFTLSCLRLGASCVVLDRFDPLETLRAIERHRVTHSQWVPTMFVRLLRLEEAEKRRFDLSSHKVAIHAAAPCPIPVKEQLLDWWGPIVWEYYGASEGGGLTLITPEEWLAHKGSVGKPAIGTFHIVNERGEEAPLGEPGVIYFEGGKAIEYHGDREKTARAHHPKGWSTVGDVGLLDAEGYLYLTDRKDFMIIVGGVNIYPQEAENVLITHPKVVDVAVFGVPNEEFGEEVKAVVQLADMRDAGPQLETELIGYCHARIAKQKSPRTIDFREEFPRSPAGKLYKRRLRDPYWEGRKSRIV